MRRLIAFLLVLPLGATAQTPEPPKAKALVKLSGGLNAYAGFYKASGISPRNQQAPLGISGAVTVSLPGGISLPFSAVLGNQGSSFRQPFNQFGVSPTYKWITLHGGYRNINFSPFTLAGHTFLGGGVELNPGLLRLGAVYGRFNQAISSTIVDPNVLPAYSRTGYAFKVGVGNASSYVDLVLLKASDDSTSIKSIAPTAGQTVKPAENLVVGITSKLRILNKFSAELDASASAYTRDTRASVVEAEATSRWFRALGSLFTPRLSTQLTQAIQAGVGYQDSWGSIKVQYKRIDPNFQTMGAYYFQSDIESYTLSPSFNLLRGKLRLSGSYGFQFDNLQENKAARTGRRIGSLVMSYNPGVKFGIDFMLSNYGISQRAGIRPLIDTLRLAQNNLSATLNTRYMIQDENISHVITFSATHQQLSDLNATTAASTENNNQNLNLGYFHQQTQTGWGLNAIFSYTQSSLPKATAAVAGSTLRFFGPTLGMSQAFLNKKLNTSLNTSYLVNQQMEQTGKVVSVSATGAYKVARRQNLNASLNYLFSDTGIQNQQFNELRGNIGYGISF